MSSVAVTRVGVGLPRRGPRQCSARPVVDTAVAPFRYVQHGPRDLAQPTARPDGLGPPGPNDRRNVLPSDADGSVPGRSSCAAHNSPLLASLGTPRTAHGAPRIAHRAPRAMQSAPRDELGISAPRTSPRAPIAVRRRLLPRASPASARQPLARTGHFRVTYCRTENARLRRVRCFTSMPC